MDRGYELTHDKRLAIGGFAQGESYNAARPRYPEEALDYFVTSMGLDEHSHVLDLGAGTGIFTRQMLPRVGRITAVEPSASMRATFARETPGTEILEGNDSAIPVEDKAVSAVFVAQAFHWFDPPRALPEIHRVLKVGGGLGLIWNERDTGVDWIRKLNKAMLWDVRQPYDANIDFGAIVAAGPFDDVHKSVFHHSELLTHRQLCDRVLTTSYITLLDEENRATLMAEVASVLAALSDPVEVPYVTNVYVAFARDNE